VNVSGVDIVDGIPNIDFHGEEASKPPKREALTEEQR
jgi:hypothetical protein